MQRAALHKKMMGASTPAQARRVLADVEAYIEQVAADPQIEMESESLVMLATANGADLAEEGLFGPIDLHLLNDKRKGSHPQKPHGSWSSNNPHQSKRAQRKLKAAKVAGKKAFAKPVMVDDDPFAEDPFDEGDDEESKYEAGLLKKLEKEEKSRFHSIIHEAGGLKTRPELKEEYAQIPNTFKRKDGMPGDEMAEYLAMYYPEFGIEDERDLIDYLAS